MEQLPRRLQTALSAHRSPISTGVMAVGARPELVGLWESLGVPVSRYGVGDMGEDAATPTPAPAAIRPLRRALLALLIERSTYGYDLAWRVQREYGDAPPPSSATIYTVIANLEYEGLIERLPLPGSGARAPHDYAVTAEGVREYEEWRVARRQ